MAERRVLPHKRLIPKYSKYDLCQEEVDELRSAFRIFEENDSGKINPKNIVAIFNSLGYQNDNQTVISMLNYLSSLSEDSLVSFDQFLEGCSKFLGKNTPTNDLKPIYIMFTEEENIDVYNILMYDYSQ